MNELHKESSPYLLQHANNPVHWKAWNNSSLTLAKEYNKLIIVSVGYSACHWCHVMEHETFENEEAAIVMNQHFVNIKVDREERPDVDAVYMKSIQIMTRRGGWPMNVVCLPDGRPIWGGTYFRKQEWIETLEQLQNLYTNNPEKVLDYAEKLKAGLDAISLIPKVEDDSNFDSKNLELLVSKWKKSFDHEFGGYTRAPKFMMPNNYAFLLRFGHQHGDKNLLDYVNLTLTKMAHGGLFDTVDGGFSRYSVDMKWHVPHFEKMLYDNAQLVSLYADAYKLTKNNLYKEVIEKTLLFISKELTNEVGGFYSALDADSLNTENHLEEGAFYSWQKEELQDLIGEDFLLFSEIFNINEFGFWEEEQKYVLIQSKSLEAIAFANNIELSDIIEKKKSWEKILYNYRENRSKPRLDDKCLTSWNAMMTKGFVDAYKALGNEDYLQIALRNASFITEKLWSPEGNLWHNYKDGKSSINGYLEDYCFTIEAFLSLYEVTLDEQFLSDAKQLTDYCFDHFFDADQEFFRFTSNADEVLITKHFEIEDNVISASNSVMANNLFKLSVYFENSYYERISKSMLEKILPNIDYPSAFANWLHLFLNYSEDSNEIALCGKNALKDILKLQSYYLPNIVFAGSINETALPFLRNRFADGQNLYYLCQNKACDLPENNFDSLLKKLNLL